MQLFKMVLGPILYPLSEKLFSQSPFSLYLSVFLSYCSSTSTAYFTSNFSFLISAPSSVLKALSEHFDLILVSEAGEDKQGIVGLVHIQNELDASRVI